MVQDKDLRPNFNFAVFHRGEIVLADVNTFGELLPRHIKAARLPDTVILLIASSSPVDQMLGPTSSLLLAISSRHSDEIVRIAAQGYLSSERSFPFLFWKDSPA